MDIVDYCAHVQLIKVVNLEVSGEPYAIYHCQLCKRLLHVEVKPVQIGVDYPAPKEEK